MKELLKDIRVSCDACHIGGSTSEKSITIWCLNSRDYLTTIKPGFSGGGDRYCIDSENCLIYSGTWENGVTCYNYVENKVVWHRSDIVGVQRVDLSVGFPESVFITLEVPDYRLDEVGKLSGVIELSRVDGKLRWRAERGDWASVDPRQALIVIEDNSSDIIRILDWRKKEVGAIPMINFSILDVSFFGDKIALAEGEKGVRIIDRKGKLISEYHPKSRKANCIRVAFSGEQVFVFDSWDGSFVTLIESTTGAVVLEYERKSHEDICFIDEGKQFIDQFGQIHRAFNGELESTLNIRDVD